MTRRWPIVLETALLVLLVAASFFVRVWSMTRVHFWDETAYMQNAEIMCCHKTNYSELDSRPPLISVIFAGVFLLWNHVYAACIVTGFINALGPLLLYMCGRMMADRIAGAIAALLLAFVPFYVGVFPSGFVSDDTGNSLLADSPALTLTLLSFWLLLRALRDESGLRFAWAGFALSLTMLMRFSSLSTIGMLGLLCLAAKRRWIAILACGIGFAVGVVPYLIWSRIAYGEFLATFISGWGNFDGPREPWLFYVQNFGIIFSWLTAAGLALWIVRLIIEKKRPWMEAFLWLWAVALLVFFSALSHQEPRYAMPAAVPLFLLAGIGLSWVFDIPSRTPRFAAVALLLAALVVTFLPVRKRFKGPFLDDEVSPEMEVSEYLDKTYPPETQLYANFNYPDYGFYSHLEVQPVLERGPGLYDALNKLPEDGIFIAYREAKEISNPKLSWLDANPHYKRLREFDAVVLYEYRVSPEEKQP